MAVCYLCGHTHRDGMKPVDDCVVLLFENGGVRYCNCKGEPKPPEPTEESE